MESLVGCRCVAVAVLDVIVGVVVGEGRLLVERGSLVWVVVRRWWLEGEGEGRWESKESGSIQN